MGESAGAAAGLIRSAVAGLMCALRQCAYRTSAVSEIQKGMFISISIFEVRLWILFKFLSALCSILYGGTLDILEGNSGGWLRIVAGKWGTKMKTEFNTTNLAVGHLQRKVAEVWLSFLYFSPSQSLRPVSTSIAGFNNHCAANIVL